MLGPSKGYCFTWDPYNKPRCRVVSMLNEVSTVDCELSPFIHVLSNARAPAISLWAVHICLRKGTRSWLIMSPRPYLHQCGSACQALKCTHHATSCNTFSHLTYSPYVKVAWLRRQDMDGGFIVKWANSSQGPIGHPMYSNRGVFFPSNHIK